MASPAPEKRIPEKREAAIDAGREASREKAKDPVHQHEPDDISEVADGLELNPKDQHPPNAETEGMWKVLEVSVVAAVVAMIVVAVIAYALFA